MRRNPLDIVAQSKGRIALGVAATTPAFVATDRRDDRLPGALRLDLGAHVRHPLITCPAIDDEPDDAAKDGGRCAPAVPPAYGGERATAHCRPSMSSG